MAILIGNSNYHQQTRMQPLEGAHRDLKQMEELLAKTNYEVYPVEDSADILMDIRGIMGKISYTLTANLQFFYAGKG